MYRVDDLQEYTENRYGAKCRNAMASFRWPFTIKQAIQDDAVQARLRKHTDCYDLIVYPKISDIDHILWRRWEIPKEAAIGVLVK